jgi:hypothetical protein
MSGIKPTGVGKKAGGGQIRKYRAGGGVERMVPVALTPGEAVIYPELANQIGEKELRRMNYADKNGYRQKRAGGGGISGGISIVPGVGDTDSFFTELPEKTFVVRKKATEALGLSGNSRQKFAQGGLAQLKSSRTYVKNIDTTFDKEPNQSIKKGVSRAKEPLRFNLKDSIQANIIREPITLTERDLEDPRIKPQNKKNYLDPNPRVRGYGFEEILSDLGRYKKETINKFSRVDGYEARGPVEVRSRDKQTSTNVLLNKLMGSILGEGSEAERLVAQKASETTLNKQANIIKAGNLIVFEDTLPLTKKYRTQEEFDKNKTKKRVRNKRPPQAQAFGEDIQRLMAGQYVKPRAGRKTREILAEVTMADVAKYPASKIIGELGVSEVDSILASAGIVGIPANKFLRQYKLDPAQQKAKQLVASKYVEKINAKAAANRTGNAQQTGSAISRGTLFGAIGMFGSSFPPEDLQITIDPDEPPITVRAFGAILDKNKAAKNARLQEREQRLQGINAKRSARGKSELLDTRAINIQGAPTAASLSKKYLKEDLSGITKRTNQTIIKSVLGALSSGGTKAFFDFDKTLAFNTNPLGYKEEKRIRGQKSKNPDYTAFGDISKVEKGLLEAKPSMLLLKLAKLVNTTRQKMPDQLGTLLSNMNVVTARPQNTMGVIGSWLASKGVPIPLNNIRGVGGSGMSNKDVAVSKANTILGMAGSSPNLFVDDDATNIAASQQAGIRSYSYGAKLPLSKAVKKSLADSQGSKFQNDITSNLGQTAEGQRLLQAMNNDTQQRSIDFPYGIGSNLAKNWFNNPLLASIPVDAKRTLTGPRAKIASNIKNFLKARSGFAYGGMVQKFADGDFVEHAGIRYSKDDVTKIATKLGVSFEQLRDEMQDRKTTGFKDYTMSAKRLGELRKLGLSSYKGLPSVVQQAFAAANPVLDEYGNHPESYRGARISGSFRRGRYAKGDIVRDPKNTLEKYFENSKYLNAGLLKKGMLGPAGRKEQAERMKDMKKLETPAPPVLYNSLSRYAFNSMASQVRLNKNPKFPPGTKYFDQEKYYDQEVAKISGKTFKLSGYLSTSANNNKAKLFLDNAERYKDGWASFMKIQTKPKAKAVNVVKQLEGRKVGGVKTDKLTGQTLYQKSPESEEEFVLRPNSSFRINSARFARPGTNKNIWMDVQQLNRGGKASRKFTYDKKPVGPSPFDTPKSSIDYFSLERGSGFSNIEFNALARDAKTNGLNLEEFQKMLEIRRARKTANLGKRDIGALKASLMDSGPQPMSANTEKLLKQLRGYAAGGEIPIMAQEGEFMLNKHVSGQIGYGNLKELNRGGRATLDALDSLPKYHTGGMIQKFAKGGATKYERNVAASATASITSSGLDVDAGKISGQIKLITASFRGLEGRLQVSPKLINYLNKSLAGIAPSFDKTAASGVASFAQLRRALQADIDTMRATGASTKKLEAAQKALATMNQVAEVATTRLYQQQSAGLKMLTNSVGQFINKIPGVGKLGALGNMFSGNAGFFASMALGAVAGQGENLMGKATTGEQAGSIAKFEGGLTTASTGLSLATGLATINPVLGGIAALGTAFIAAGDAVGDFSGTAQKAAREFDRAQIAKKIEDSGERLTKVLGDLASNINNIDLLDKLDAEIKTQVEQQRKMQSSAIAETKETKRAEKIGKMDTLSYVGSFFDPSSYRGGSLDTKTSDFKVEDFENIASAQSKAYEMSSQGALLKLEQELKRGVGLGEAQKKLNKLDKEAIVGATDTKTQAQILKLEAERIDAQAAGNAALEQEIVNKKESIINEAILNNQRLKSIESQIKLSQAAEEAANQTRLMSMAFERINNVFTQGMNKLEFELESIDRATQSFVNSLTGTAKIEVGKSKNINILENPNAYSTDEVKNAAQTLSKPFGASSDEMAEVLSLDMQSLSDS